MVVFMIWLPILARLAAHIKWCFSGWFIRVQRGPPWLKEKFWQRPHCPRILEAALMTEFFSNPLNTFLIGL
ncbi:MAG: hypothetical protein MUC91_07150, partial [Verrucomicrobia bacterium]|nr:hypothetical protein [Verrucomicrobiota bacterium]